MDTNLVFENINTPNQIKWFAHYKKLCIRAASRKLPNNIYVERHHVFPRCIFGKNDIIIKLFPEEHFVSHQLLAKIYPNNRQIVFAAVMMTIGNNNMQRTHNKLYGWLQRRASETQKGRERTFEFRQKLSKACKGIPKTDDHKQKISKGLKGKPKSEEHRQKLRDVNTGKRLSEETKRKISEGNKGKILTTEQRKNYSEANRRRWRSGGNIGKKGIPCTLYC